MIFTEFVLKGHRIWTKQGGERRWVLTSGAGDTYKPCTEKYSWNCCSSIWSSFELRILLLGLIFADPDLAYCHDNLETACAWSWISCSSHLILKMFEVRIPCFCSLGSNHVQMMAKQIPNEAQMISKWSQNNAQIISKWQTNDGQWCPKNPKRFSNGAQMFYKWSALSDHRQSRQTSAWSLKDWLLPALQWSKAVDTKRCM